MSKHRTMKSAIETILAAHQLLAEFRANRFYSVRIESEGFMPLTIERQDDCVIVAHYFEQNGDLIPDPDMEFFVKDDREWLPVAIQQPTGHYTRAGEAVAKGVWVFQEGVVAELSRFSAMWARNLLTQGFAEGQIIRAGVR